MPAWIVLVLLVILGLVLLGRGGRRPSAAIPSGDLPAWDVPGWLADRLNEFVYTLLSVNALAFLASLMLFAYVAIFVPQRALSDVFLLVVFLAGLYTGRREFAKYLDMRFGDATSYEEAANRSPMAPGSTGPLRARGPAEGGPDADDPTKLP